MRVKRGFARRRGNKRLLKLSEGMRARRRNCVKLAKRGVQKALKYAYRDRRQNKRNYRMLWIARINAALRAEGLVYSRFIASMKKARVDMNRKMLADLAFNDQAAFKAVVQAVTAKAA